MQLGNRHFKLHGSAVVASLLVCLVLLLDAMAACPALHELIHNDAGKADHDCAVTMFAHGKVDSVTLDVLIPTPLIFVASSPLVKFSIFAPAIENLPAGRAPPVFVSNS